MGILTMIGAESLNRYLGNKIVPILLLTLLGLWLLIVIISLGIGNLAYLAFFTDNLMMPYGI
jgi:hypothetical protein